MNQVIKVSLVSVTDRVATLFAESTIRDLEYVKWQYSLAENPTSDDQWKTIYNGSIAYSSRTFTLTGLTPGTRYSVWVRAQVSVSEPYDGSNKVTFDTQSDSTYSLLHIELEDILDHEAKFYAFSQTAIFDLWQYTLVDEPQESDWITFSETTGKNKTFVVTPLQASYDYRIRIRAKSNSSVEYEVSKPLVFRTMPEFERIKVRLKSVTDTSAIFTIDGYGVAYDVWQYRTSHGGGWQTFTPSSDFELEIDSLLSGTGYWIAVRAKKNTDSTYTQSIILHFRTTPEVTSNLMLSNLWVSPTSATFYAEGLDGEYSGYQYSTALNPDPTSDGFWTDISDPIVEGNGIQFSIDHTYDGGGGPQALEANTSYSIRVRAKKNGSSEYTGSTYVIFRTEPQPVSYDIELDVKEITSKSVQIYAHSNALYRIWESSVAMNPGSGDWTVQANETDPMNGLTFTISNLQENTQYPLMIRCKANPSSEYVYSASIVIQTAREPIDVYTPPGTAVVHTTQVDFVRRPINDPVKIVQYDDKCPIVAVSLFKNGEPFAISDAGNVRLNIRFGKPDHTFVYNPAEGINEDRTIAYFKITKQMTVFDGLFSPIVEYLVGNEIAGSGSFDVRIDRNPIQQGDIESSVEYKTVQEYAESAQEAAEILENCTASAHSLPTGSTATAEYDPVSGNFDFGIPSSGDSGVSSINGKTGAVTLTPGDIDYDGTETYPNGSLGEKVKDIDERAAGVSSVNGKTGAVELDSGDLPYDSSAQYDDDTVGKQFQEVDMYIEQQVNRLDERIDEDEVYVDKLDSDDIHYHINKFDPESMTVGLRSNSRCRVIPFSRSGGTDSVVISYEREPLTIDGDGYFTTFSYGSLLNYQVQVNSGDSDTLQIIQLEDDFQENSVGKAVQDLEEEVDGLVTGVSSVNGQTGDVEFDYVRQVNGKTGQVLLTPDDISYSSSPDYAEGSIGKKVQDIDSEVDGLVTGVSSVNGKEGEVVLNPGDIGYDGTATYPDGSLGEKVKDIDGRVTGVSSVNGKDGTVVLRAGDIPFNPSVAYEDGTIGKELKDLDEKKANIDGYYVDLTSGTTEQIISTKGVTDTEQKPYLIRKTGDGLPVGNRKEETLVGVSVAWNQLSAPTNTHTINEVACTKNSDGSVTINGTASATGSLGTHQNIVPKSGHIYLVSANDEAWNAGLKVYAGLTSSGTVKSRNSVVKSTTNSSSTVSFRCSEGQSFSNVKGYLITFDLTLMFGADIAEAILSKENTEAGSGIAWIRSYGFLTKDYYPYNPGSIISAAPTGIQTNGFNQWDEEWEVVSSHIESKNYIPVIGGTNYYWRAPNNYQPGNGFKFFDADKNLIKTVYTFGATKIIEMPNNCRYVKFAMLDAYGTTYNHDICINLSDSSRNGEYEPFVGHTYPLDGSDLRGILKYNSTRQLIYADGDIETATKRNTRYGIVDLGTLNPVYDSTNVRFYIPLTGIKPVGTTSVPNIICTNYLALTGHDFDTSRTVSKTIRVDDSISRIYIRDLDYTVASTFKQALSGVYLVYELATPVETEGAYFPAQIVVDPEGTELFEDPREVPIPVGHDTFYEADLRSKLEDAPNNPTSDGKYLLNKDGDEVEYTPYNPEVVPDGTYDSMAVGNLVSTVLIEDSVPYNFRTAGGSVDIGVRAENKFVGGTIAWNQLIHNGNFATPSTWARNRCDFTVADNVGTFTCNSNQYGSWGFYQNPVGVIGHKCLVLCIVRTRATNQPLSISLTSSDSRIQNVVGNKTVLRPINNIWYALSFIGVVKNTSATVVVSENQNGGEDVTIGDVLEAKDFVFFDLTQMFGSAIADYIYSLETATAGAGVAWFKKYFPKDYYPYAAGGLKSVKVGAYKTTEFNQWDEEWEKGKYNVTTGAKVSSDTQIRCKNLVPVLPNTLYYFKSPNSAWGIPYDANKNVIAGQNMATTTSENATLLNGLFTTPTDCRYISFYEINDYGATYNHDICIHLAYDGERNGEYEPYREHIYPLDTSIELRGILKLDAANRLYYDGDTYASDGTVTRKYGIVDLGTLNWTYYTSATYPYFRSTGLKNVIKKVSSNANVAKIVCAKYITTNANQPYSGAATNCIGIFTDGVVFIYEPNKTGSDLTDGHASWLDGVYLVYELAEPTTSQAEPFTAPQIVDNWGTETLTDYAYEAGNRDVEIPVGHETFYQQDLRAKLEVAPDSPDGDGDYIVRQTNGANEYVPLLSELPAYPSEDGTYDLRITVSNGTVTKSWVAVT